MSFRKNDRVVVLSGPRAGREGKIIRKQRSEWMVKLDGRMFPDFFYPGEIRKV